MLGADKRPGPPHWWATVWLLYLLYPLTADLAAPSATARSAVLAIIVLYTTGYLLFWG